MQVMLRFLVRDLDLGEPFDHPLGRKPSDLWVSLLL